MIEWNGNYQLHDFYKILLNLHSQNPALNGDHAIAPVFRIHTSDGDKVLSYLRKKGADEVLVVLNLSDELLDVVVDDTDVKGKFTEVFTKKTNNFLENRSFKMKAWSYYVFKK